MEKNYNSTGCRALEYLGVYGMVLPVLSLAVLYTGLAIGGNHDRNIRPSNTNMPGPDVTEKNLTAEKSLPRKIFRNTSLERIPEFH